MGENQYSRYVLVHFYPETFPGIMQKKTEVIYTAEIHKIPAQIPTKTLCINTTTVGQKI